MRFPNYVKGMTIRVSEVNIDRFRKQLKGQKALEKRMRKTNPEWAAKLRIQIAQTESAIEHLEQLSGIHKPSPPLKVVNTPEVIPNWELHAIHRGFMVKHK